MGRGGALRALGKMGGAKTKKCGHGKRGKGWFSDAFQGIPLIGKHIKSGLDSIYNKVHPGENKWLGDKSAVGQAMRPVMHAAVGNAMKGLTEEEKPSSSGGGRRRR